MRRHLLERAGGHQFAAGLGIFLGDGEGPIATLANVFGWAFAIWGIGLYWWAGLLYAWQVRKLMADRDRRAPSLSDL